MNNSKETSEFFNNLLFLKIFQSFRIAIHPKNLIIAFLSLAIIWGAGRVFDLNPTVVTNDCGVTELDVYLQNPEQLPNFINDNKQAGTETGVFETVWKFLPLQFHSLINSLVLSDDFYQLLNVVSTYIRAIQWVFLYHPIYAVIFSVLKLAVIAIGGGAICRISALQFAKGEKPGLFEAVRFSTKKFRSLFAAPLVPGGIIVVLGLFIYIIGLLANIPYTGRVILGILMPLALFWGLLAAVVAIGSAAGFGLMFPVIAYEGSDSFDAASRSFSYIFARPWRTIFYGSVAFIYGLTCYLFVRFFAFLVLFITRSFLKISIFTDNDNSVNTLTALWPEVSFANFSGFSNANISTMSEYTAATLILISLLIVSGVVLSFFISFFFTANTIIYALLRNKVDRTETSDIYIGIDEKIVNSKS
jgi:hypothetical protein